MRFHHAFRFLFAKFFYIYHYSIRYKFKIPKFQFALHRSYLLFLYLRGTIFFNQCRFLLCVVLIFCAYDLIQCKSSICLIFAGLISSKYATIRRKMSLFHYVYGLFRHMYALFQGIYALRLCM